jgi:hypothetical protein
MTAMALRPPERRRTGTATRHAGAVSVATHLDAQ